MSKWLVLRRVVSKDRKVLYVLGLGFDPRTLRCFETIFQNKGKSSIDCLVIEYNDDFEAKEPMSTSLKNNTADLEKIIPRNKWNSKIVEIKSSVDYSMSVDIVTKLKKKILIHTRILLLILVQCQMGFIFH